jgi:hypothetical protein
MKYRSISQTAVACLLLALAACGGGDGGVPGLDGGSSGSSGGGGSNNGSCTQLTLGDLAPDQTPGWYVAEVKNSDLANTYLRIELDPKNSYTFKSGTANLGAAPNDNYSTCTNCVLMFEQGAADQEAKVFFQKGGSMSLDTVSNPPNGASKGSISGVDLAEVTIDAKTGASTLVTGGSCYSVASLSWDTTASTDTTCDTANDCGDPETQVCDPSTAKCAPSECDGTSAHACSGSKVCIAQSESSSAGACYDNCTPFGSTACATGTECVTLTYDQASGVCYKKGTAAEGEACKTSLVNTNCAAGLRCVKEMSGTFCRKACDFLNGKNGCPTGQACVPGSYCSSDSVDPANIGDDCGTDVDEGSPCALSSGVATGVCASNGSAYKCSKICRMSLTTDCTDPQVCMDYFGSLGICN